MEYRFLCVHVGSNQRELPPYKYKLLIIP